MSDNSLKENEEDSSNFWLKAAAAVFAGATAVYTADKVVNKIGFEETGIRKGSPAASYQSKHYGGEVPKEGLFSSLQSTGATGFSTGQLLGFGLAAGAVTLGISEVIDQLGKSSEPSKKKEEE